MPTPPTAPAAIGPITRTVLLKHRVSSGLADGPDGRPWGDWHLDWLIELPDRQDEHRVRAFRVPANHAGPTVPRPFPCATLPDHRAFYLDHEGPLTGGRGSIERLAHGTALVLVNSTAAFEVITDFGEAPIRWHAGPETGADDWAPWIARVVIAAESR